MSSQTSINLIRTPTTPLQSVLIASFTSLAVNFIAWNKAYSLFPLSTFVHHDAYLFGDTDLDDSFPKELTLSRYVKQGWNFEHTSWPEAKIAEGRYPVRPLRCVTGRLSWVIPFDTKDIATSQTPDYVTDYSTFDVGPGKNFDELRTYIVSAPVIESSVLKHSWICGSFGWSCFLKRILDYTVLAELHKLPEDARPLNFEWMVQEPDGIHRRMDAESSESWTYYDDQIPGWYKEWQTSIVGPSP